MRANVFQWIHLVIDSTEALFAATFLVCWLVLARKSWRVGFGLSTIVFALLGILALTFQQFLGDALERQDEMRMDFMIVLALRAILYAGLVFLTAGAWPRNHDTETAAEDA